MNLLCYFNLVTLFLCMTQIFVQSEEVDVKKVQCLVCQVVVDKIEKEIEKISPNRKVDVGHYRLDDQGDTVKEKIEYRRSEMFLADVFDTVCESMDDWVKAKYKSNGQLVILPILINGVMNSLLNEVDVIPDSNLNKNIKLYCETILEEHEDTVLKLFRNGSDNIDIKLCSATAKLCNEMLEPEEDYLFEDEKDEL